MIFDVWNNFVHTFGDKLKKNLNEIKKFDRHTSYTYYYYFSDPLGFEP